MLVAHDPSGAVLSQWRAELSKPSPHPPCLIVFLELMRAPRAGVMGGWLVDQPVQGPSLATKGVLGGTPIPVWFMVPRLVRRPVYVPWPKFFFFFYTPTQHCIALRVAREVR